jgi:hypothetical protein
MTEVGRPAVLQKVAKVTKVTSLRFIERFCSFNASAAGTSALRWRRNTRSSSRSKGSGGFFVDGGVAGEGGLDLAPFEAEVASDLVVGDKSAPFVIVGSPHGDAHSERDFIDGDEWFVGRRSGGKWGLRRDGRRWR